MGPVEYGTCQTVVPLLARYSDPDLTEAEQIQLSMHLYHCSACRARLQEYRTLDRQVRTLPSVALAPRVRAAVLDHIAASGAGLGGPAVVLTWRHAWPGATLALSLATFILAAGLTTALAAQRTDGHIATSAATSGALPRPLMASLQGANPTAAIGMSVSANDSMAVKRPLVKAQATRPAAVAATIRAINPTESRIVVAVEGAVHDERLLIMRDTAILLPDGRPGTLADLVVGAQVQLQRETTPAGGTIAREIVVSR